MVINFYGYELSPIGFIGILIIVIAFAWVLIKSIPKEAGK